MQAATFTTFKMICLAGLAGQLAFEAYAWLISPMVFGPTLEPANLVTAIGAKIAGIVLPYGPAFIIHFLIGAVLFALMVYAAQLVLRRGYILAGLATGLVLWFVAQGILAPFIGRSFMMDFGPYTQSSFVAHTGMTLVIGFVMSKLLQKNDVPA
ncbi:MAG: hypothetical protein ACJASV_001399 [Pseudorhodobacter sp.]|jgi:hypothetical protein